ncbi:MAG: hypothetical protein JWM89_3037 [Acidimicrobiales bacterium]|nr:hypothetical protein [Acidimicrobiales bacterium]
MVSPRLEWVQPADLADLYRVESAHPLFVDWRFRGTTISPWAFAEMNSRDVLANWILWHGNEPAGLLSLSQHSGRSQTAALGVVTVGSGRTRDIAAATILLMEFGFEVGLQIIYATIAEFNLVSAQAALSRHFDLEVVRRGAERHRGRQWDSRVYALHHRDWNGRLAWLARRARLRVNADEVMSSIEDVRRRSALAGWASS